MLNRIINKLERRFGRYAIQHLTIFLVIGWFLGYALSFMGSGSVTGGSSAGSVILSYMTLDIHQIFHGQVWRLITWILIPPSSSGIWTILMMIFFYIPIGNSLERVWGDFRYNLYIFNGMLIFVVTAIICYLVFGMISGVGSATGAVIGQFFTTYYIAMSIVLAFAATFPDSTVLLMFIIPFKMKWLGFVYAGFMIFDAIGYLRNAFSGGPGSIYYIIPVIAMLASLTNFGLFFLTQRSKRTVHLSRKEKEIRNRFRSNMERTRDHQSITQPEMRVVQGVKPRHRCEVCGRTDISDPDLEFRFCTRCSGAHEYCMDHLYTHEHISDHTGEEK
jgi:hypothetical protein